MNKYLDIEKEFEKLKEKQHHIEEANKLLEQGRFTLQEVGEKLSFLMADLYLVMERIKSMVELDYGT